MNFIVKIFPTRTVIAEKRNFFPKSSQDLLKEFSIFNKISYQETLSLSLSDCLWVTVNESFRHFIPLKCKKHHNRSGTKGVIKLRGILLFCKQKLYEKFDNVIWGGKTRHNFYGNERVSFTWTETQAFSASTIFITQLRQMHWKFLENLFQTFSALDWHFLSWCFTQTSTTLIIHLQIRTLCLATLRWTAIPSSTARMDSLSSVATHEHK